MLSSLSSVCLPVSYSYFILTSFNLFYVLCLLNLFLSHTVTFVYIFFSFDFLSCGWNGWPRLLLDKPELFNVLFWGFLFSSARCLRWCPSGEDPIQQKGYRAHSNGWTSSSPTWYIKTRRSNAFPTQFGSRKFIFSFLVQRWLTWTNWNSMANSYEPCPPSTRAFRCPKKASRMPVWPRTLSTRLFIVSRSPAAKTTRIFILLHPLSICRIFRKRKKARP